MQDVCHSRHRRCSGLISLLKFSLHSLLGSLCCVIRQGSVPLYLGVWMWPFTRKGDWEFYRKPWNLLHEIYFVVSGRELKISHHEFKILQNVSSDFKNRAVNDIQLSSLAERLVRNFIVWSFTSFRFASFFNFFICSHNKSLLQEFSSSFGNIATCTKHKKLNLLAFLFIQPVIPTTTRHPQ